MKRAREREAAFLLLFEHSFTGAGLDTTIANAQEVEDSIRSKDSGFIRALFEGVDSNIEKLDAVIFENAPKWGRGRISRVSLTLMRIAVYEMLFRSDIPVSVSINEAVELSKKYGAEDESGFVNGVLGGIGRVLPETLR